jgi:hypothetical protein
MFTSSAEEKKKKVKRVKTAEEVLLLFVDICGWLGVCDFVIQFSCCFAMFCLQ